MSALASFVSGIPVSQWLCPSSMFSTNVFFYLSSSQTTSRFWIYPPSLSTSQRIPQRCCWLYCGPHCSNPVLLGGYNSVLCDQEPHSPGCCTSWQTTQVRCSINDSATLRDCDETTFSTFCISDFFQAGCWICVSQCSSLCGWVSPSVKSWRCRVTLTLNVISPPGFQNRQQSHVGMLAF